MPEVILWKSLRSWEKEILFWVYGMWIV